MTDPNARRGGVPLSCDLMLVIPAQTMADDQGATPEAMRARHTNLE
jgi:hypothetical protein